MRRIDQCLNQKLSEILQSIRLIDALNTKVFNHLPEHLRTHCSVGSFNQGCLVLVTRDPVWASQLRFYLPELRDALRQKAGIHQLASVKITVSTDDVQAIKAQQKRPPLSAKTRKTIMAGSRLCQYVPLKDALQKLAQESVPITEPRS